MSTPTFLDVHVLHTLPYSNVNRDDLGSPKTVVYGGTERTRVSSQSWKRTVRHRVEERLGDPAVRTRRIVGEIAGRLTALGWDPSLAEQGGHQIVLSAAKGGIKLEKEKEGESRVTSVLFYLPVSAVDALAAIAHEHREAVAKESAKKTPKGILPADDIVAVLRSRNATVNLFGRMLAELPSTEVDGAVQFAHAFTTHCTSVEVDFFTAVDDVPKENDRGSGHMNVGQFSTGTFYRYANIDLAGLLRNLDGDTAAARELVSEFLRAFLGTVPSGKQNATAAMTLPDLAHVVVRSDRPVSYAPAFEAAVRGTEGFTPASVSRLSDYAGKLGQLWWPDTVLSSVHAGIDDKPVEHLGERLPGYPNLVETAMTAAYPGERVVTGLLLRLAGPMQSWGEHSAFGERDTLGFPSRSGLVGMFAAAQGVGRDESLERYDDLRLLVRVDARGVRMTDFHTVGGGLPRERTVPTAEGKRRPEGATTIVTRRAYLADAVFTVAVTGPGTEDIGRSLLSPHWQTYLGRRSFVPDPLLVLRVQAPDPEHELRTAVPLPRRRVPEGRETVEVELVSEQVSAGDTDTDGRTILNDVPRSFASARRRYTSREVRVERAALSTALVSGSIRQYQERLMAYVKEHR